MESEGVHYGNVAKPKFQCGNNYTGIQKID